MRGSYCYEKIIIGFFVIIGMLFFVGFDRQKNKHPNEAVIINQVSRQGFALVERSESWLGRVNLEFRSDDQERQIILNPANGEALRDYSEGIHQGSEEGDWFSHLLSPFFGDGD